MTDRPWNKQPHRVIGEKFTNFQPDVVMVVKSNTKTGQIMVESGNGKPLNPWVVVSLCIEVTKGNIGTLIQQQSMIIDPTHKTDPVGIPVYTEAEHAYEPGANPETCRVCGRDPRNILHQPTKQDVQ